MKFDIGRIYNAVFAALSGAGIGGGSAAYA